MKPAGLAVSISLWSGHFPQLGLPPDHSELLCQSFEILGPVPNDPELFFWTHFEAAQARAQKLGFDLACEQEARAHLDLEWLVASWHLYPSASLNSANPREAARACLLAAWADPQAAQARGGAGACLEPRRIAAGPDAAAADAASLSQCEQSLLLFWAQREAEALSQAAADGPRARKPSL